MANYISSNANRFYVVAEDKFGQATPPTSGNRFPAHRLEATQSFSSLRRTDKTGSRSHMGQPGPLRRHAAFAVKTYLSAWSGAGQPAYGPLFEAVTGGRAESIDQLIVASGSGQQLVTTTSHGLNIGSAVSFAGEIRFVTQVVDVQSVVINAPLSRQPRAGDLLAPTMGYRLGTAQPSVTLYDFWDPLSAVSRIITGAGADKLTLTVNGDYHDFTFSGPACDLVDSRTFSSGDSGLQQFPAEPALSPFDPTGVPGHLGQAWIGQPNGQFLTLTEAQIRVNNNLQLRDQEFGSLTPRAIVPGPREVSVDFTLLVQDDPSMMQIYSAAKSRTPVPVMLQLGIQQGRLFGVYLPNVTPELPAFDDQETRLKWRFSNSVAQGRDNDEIFLAFA